MTWYYLDQPITSLPDDCVGFVYLITNTTNQRKYIGKKLAKFSKTTYKTVTQKNGVKKRKAVKSKIDSDWQDYWGSSQELAKDIEQLGPAHFRRKIICFCKSKAECSYKEAKEQFARGVLESDEYYNNAIMVRVHGSHIKNNFSRGRI